MKMTTEVADAISDLKSELGIDFYTEFQSRRGRRTWCRPASGALHEKPFGVSSCGCTKCRAYELLDAPYTFTGRDIPCEVWKKALEILKIEVGFRKFHVALQGDMRPLSVILRADGTIDLKNQPFREWLPN